MANSSMLHVRVDDELKSQASETLSHLGLTVSDAVRILLTRITQEGGMPTALLMDAEAHDQWFRAKVNEALEDDSPAIPFEEVMADIDQLLESKRANAKR